VKSNAMRETRFFRSRGPFQDHCTAKVPYLAESDNTCQATVVRGQVTSVVADLLACSPRWLTISGNPHRVRSAYLCHWPPLPAIVHWCPVMSSNVSSLFLFVSCVLLLPNNLRSTVLTDSFDHRFDNLQQQSIFSASISFQPLWKIWKISRCYILVQSLLVDRISARLVCLAGGKSKT